MFHLVSPVVIMGQIVMVDPDGDNSVQANTVTAPARWHHETVNFAALHGDPGAGAPRCF